MRTLIFAASGAVLGLFLAAGNAPILGLAVGGLLGWLLAESGRKLTESGRRFELLDGEIALLRKRVRELETRDERPSATEPAPAVESTTPSTPAPPDRPVAPPRPATPAPVPPAQAPSRREHRAAPAASVAPNLERKTDPFQRVVSTVKDWLTTGNVPVKVGVIISFFGVSFLLKWAVDRKLLFFPIELRLAAVAAGGVAMLVIGWRLRARMRVYALSLQGGAVGILYLTIFATYRIYELIPAGLAFGLLVLLTAFSGMLAVLQDSKAMAILGTMGGFLAPILASTGSGNHVALFSYYLILNSAIFGIAWFKIWRELNLLGFLFTYVIGWTWGAAYYKPELLSSTLPFVILFFLLFVAMAVLYAYRRATVLKDYVDGTLVFGTPVFTFAMLAGLLSRTENAMAAASVTAALVYLVTATALHRLTTPRHRLLVEAFLALGVAFGTMAIPLALDARWTSAAWALEGAALVWVGVRQQRLLARGAGVLLVFAAGAAFLGESRAGDSLPVLNGDYLGMLMISLAALFCSFYLDRREKDLQLVDRMASYALLGWGLAWWSFGGLLEIDSQVPARFGLAVVIVFCAASPALGVLLSRSLGWPKIAWPGFAVVPALTLLALTAMFFKSHPLKDGGWIAWPLSLMAVYWILRRFDDALPQLSRWLHPPALWLSTGIVALELAWRVGQLSDNLLWQGVVVTGFLGCVSLLVMRAPIGWPLARHADLYRTAGIGPLLMTMTAFVIGLNFTPGDPAPLPYIPIANPLDLLGIFSAVALIMWLLEVEKDERTLDDPRVLGTVIAAMGFLLSTATVVRTVHHWGGVPFEGRALFESVVLQATLSLFWGSLGLTAMIAGARRSSRRVWFAGAVLMALVVAKLFLIDLGNSGTLARVFSFIGVGVLLLVVGYFAGVPPRRETNA